MSAFEKLRKFHSEAEQLRDEANASPNLKEKLHYERCYSGPLDNVDMLFCGINPGFGMEDWLGRSIRTGHRELVSAPCKYIEESSGAWSLGGAVIDVLLNGDASRLEHCAETSLRSFFATPDERILASQFQNLTSDWRARHDDMMRDYLDFLVQEVRPSCFVCFGVGVFDKIVAMMQLTRDEDTNPPDFGRRYFLKSELGGIPFYGLIHLSGGRPVGGMKDWLRTYFSELR
jgi:hypothetical protein